MKRLLAYIGLLSLLLTTNLNGQIKISELNTRDSGSLSANSNVWFPVYDSGAPTLSYRVSFETLGTVLSAGSVVDGDYGDVSISSGVWSVDAGAVAIGDLANISTSTILGRATAGTGVVEALTATQVRTLINVESGADVTDATNVDAAGAVMNSDTSTASMSFVIDDDTMATASATTTSTSESIKAYVDANAGGGTPDAFQTIADGDATPSITSGNLMRTANTGATTITNFDDGSSTDLIIVFIEDANTTIAHNSNIVLHGAADRTASTGGAIVRLRHNGTQWVEEGIGSTFDHTVSVNVDGSDNLTISNAATDADLVLDTTGTGGTNNLAVNGTNRVIVDNTSVDIVGTLKNNGTAFLIDEDSFATDSATRAPSQQSVKAYVDANAGGSSVAPKHLWNASSYIVAVQPGATSSASSPGNNAIVLQPFPVDHDITIDEIKFEVTTGAAFGARVLMYDDDGTGGYPGTLLYQGSSIDCTATGIKTETIGSPIAVSAGTILWIGVWTESNGIGIKNVNSTNYMIGSTGSTLGSSIKSLYSTATAYSGGTAPNPSGFTTTEISTNPPAFILIGVQ